MRAYFMVQDKILLKLKEGKDISEDNPFSRRPTRVTTYWSMKTDGENNAKAAAEKAAKMAEMNAETAAAGNERKEEEDEEDAFASSTKR